MRWPVCATVLLALSAGTQTHAAPIRGILIHHVGNAPTPLGFSFDQETGEGVLTVDIESFTLMLTREGEENTEFIVDASFHMEATGMTDVSQAPLAAGNFTAVEFELWDRSGEEPQLLLQGQQLTDAAFNYAETPAAVDLMSILSAPVSIVGGSLAQDFDTHVILFGQAIQIDPGTEAFEQLDTDHTGSITLELVPIPEAGSVALWGIVAAWFGRRRRSDRRKQARALLVEENRKLPPKAAKLGGRGKLMIGLRTMGCYVAPVLGVLVLANVAQASVLNDLILEEVAATYTYNPERDMLGVLEINDTNVGYVAILKDGPPIVGTTDIFLSIELTAELGDPNDQIAHGLFGPGVLTMTHGSSDGDPPANLLEANFDDGFDLFEIGSNSGSHQGFGTFSSAVYGGDFDGVTSPTSGDVFALIFTWYSDEAKTQPLNVQNYTDSMDPGTIIYADVTLNVLPEPTSLVPLATMAIWLLRRRWTA